MISALGVRLVVAALAGGYAYACVYAGPEGGRALADSPVVALVRPAASTPSTTEALNRIEGELTAEGFDVVMVDAPLTLGPSARDATPVRPGAEGAAASAPAGPDREAIASIELVVDARERAAELRVMDRLTNKTVVRRAAIEAPDGPQFAQVLAVRAVELLRASLVEVLILSHPPPTEMPPAAARAAVERARTWTATALDAKGSPSYGFDAGTAVLAGFGGVAPAVLGVLRVRRMFGRALEVRATLAGLGTQPIVHAASGSASITQDLGLVELLFTPWDEHAVRPVVSLGAGPYYVAVDGQATWPYAPTESNGWSVALDGGLGVEVRLGRHFDLSFEAHAVVTQPSQVTRFVGEEQASISEPSLLGTLTVVGWL